MHLYNIAEQYTLAPLEQRSYRDHTKAIHVSGHTQSSDPAKVNVRQHTPGFRGKKKKIPFTVNNPDVPSNVMAPLL